MEKIGYSVVDLHSNTEVAWSDRLPIAYTWDNGNKRGSFDKVGLVAPSIDDPVYKTVERWQTDAVPAGQNLLGYTNPVYDGTRVNVQGTYETIPQADLNRPVRYAEFQADADVADLQDKLKNATPAQINAWMTANVTDLASARLVLTKIVKYLATRV